MFKAKPIAKSLAYLFRSILLASGCFFILIPVISQPTAILFDHYNTENGLSNNTIWDIHKTRFGYIWLATQDGLSRFDGRDFRVFRYSASDTQSISNNTVYRLLEDSAGYFWVGTFSGLNMYNPAFQQFTRIRNGSWLDKRTGRVGIGAIAQSKEDEKVWVGTRGLFYVNREKAILVPAPGKMNDELFSSNGNISSLWVESGERIWIGTETGIILYNPKKGSYVLYPLQVNGKANVKVLVKDMLFAQGKLWLATWGFGLLAFDTASKNVEGPYLPEQNDGFKGGANIIFDIAQTNYKGEENVLWLAGNAASLVAFDVQTKTFIHHRAAQPAAKKGMYGAALSLFFDESEGLWVGGEQGIYRYDPRLQVFDEHAFKFSFPEKCLDEVFETYADVADSSNPVLWVGTWSCGLFRYNPSTRQVMEIPAWMKSQLKDLPYNRLLRDRTGILWIATGGDGLLRVDEKQKRVEKFFPEIKDGTTAKVVLSVAEDAAGAIWAGTTHGLFVKEKDSEMFQPVGWTVSPAISSKFSKTVNGLCCDANGNIWFSSQNDFNEEWPVIGRVAKGTRTAVPFYRQPDRAASLPDIKVITSLTCDQKNRMWASTWNGLLSWDATADNPSFKLYTTDDGLLNNFINKVQTDEAGNIWCATISGLSGLVNGGKKFRNFSHAGLEQDNISELFFDPFHKNLVIAGWGKLHLLNTTRIMKESSPPRIIIVDFRVFNKPAKEVDKYVFNKSVIELAHNRNVVTIDFAALTFYNPRQVRYAYRMEGVDKDWIITSNNSVTYNLTDGHYIFHVKGMNAEGVWNEEGTWMDITVTAPFWKKAWFIGGIIALTIAIFYGVYLYRIRQIKKVQVMRNSISQNLHDDIGSSLSNINILNEMAKRNAASPEKSKQYLDKAGEDIQRISESLSDIVWNINPRYDDLQNLFVRMKRYAADMMDGKDITYELEFPADDPGLSLPMEKRRNMYLVFKEAINNLVKYSKTRKAVVRVEAGKKKIFLLVRDYGIGFSMGSVSSGNGITNMQQRAAACQAELMINSEPGKGTEIRLEMGTT